MYLFTYKQRRRIHADGTFVIGVQNYTRRHPPILSGTRGNKRSVLFTAQRGRHLFTIDATTNSFFFFFNKTYGYKQQLCFLIDNCSRGIKKNSFKVLAAVVLGRSMIHYEGVGLFQTTGQQVSSLNNRFCTVYKRNKLYYSSK